MATGLGGLKDRFASLRLPPRPPDGTMSLVDHLRELRYRVMVSLAAVVVTSSVAGIFYARLVEVVMWPWYLARTDLLASNPGIEATVVNQGVGAPFLLALKVSLVAGLIAACPVWLWQLWAFVVPALRDREKRYAKRFLIAAVPLFLVGCVAGYAVLPKGISVMLSFTPANLGITNLLEVNQFLTLELILVLVFGVSFLLPVVLVMLNAAGVVTAAQLGRTRSYSLFGCFAFAAVATPGTDPFSMLALALPMALLYGVAELICRVNDRRRASRPLAAD